MLSRRVASVQITWINPKKSILNIGLYFSAKSVSIGKNPEKEVTQLTKTKMGLFLVYLKLKGPH